MCVCVCVCLYIQFKPDIEKIQRYSHTSIHTSQC